MLFRSHPTPELRRLVNSAGTVTFTWQCQECGCRLGDVKSRLVDGRDHVKLLDHSLRENRRSGWTLTSSQAATPYGDYIQSEEWRRRRAPVLQRSGGICEFCQNAPAVHVHHLHYQTLGNERTCDLVACCGACHAAADVARERGICPLHGTDIRAAGETVRQHLFAIRDQTVRVCRDGTLGLDA